MTDSSFLEALLDSCGIDASGLKEFAPAARYLQPIDSLIYLSEDCPYRTQVVDENFSLLQHPQEYRIVGIKLNGFSSLVRSSL